MQDFPYNFEEDVEHHNIWSTIPLDEKRMLEVGLPCPFLHILMDLLSSIGILAQQTAPHARLLCERCASSPQIVILAAVPSESWVSGCWIHGSMGSHNYMKSFQLGTIGSEAV